MEYLSNRDLIEKVLPYLEPEDVGNLIITCKTLSELIRNLSEIWIILGLKCKLYYLGIDFDLETRKRRELIKYLKVKKLFGLFSNLKIGKRHFIPKSYYSDAYHMYILERWLGWDHSTVWSLYDIVTYPEDIRRILMLNCQLMNIDNCGYLDCLINDIPNIIKQLSNKDLFDVIPTSEILKHIYLSNYDGNTNIYVTNCKLKTWLSNPLLFYPINITLEIEEDYERLGYDDFYIVFCVDCVLSTEDIKYRLISQNEEHPEEKEITDQEFIELTGKISSKLNFNHKILNNLIIVGLTIGNIRLIENRNLIL